MSDIPDLQSMFRLDGKVAVVTGGSRGIGLHAATAFLLAGARKVIITARKEDGLIDAAKQLNSLPSIAGKVISIVADLSKTSQVMEFVKKVTIEEPQGVDIVIANAGATWGGPFEPTPDESSIKVLDLNVRSIFNLVRLMVPLLEKAGTPVDPSRVVIVGSTAGTNVPHVGDHGTIMYSASKAAAHHLARNLAVELGPRNITSNAVAPGFFPSKLANGLIEILGGDAGLKADNPRRRLGEPQDFVGVVLFLTSPAGAYMWVLLNTEVEILTNQRGC